LPVKIIRQNHWEIIGRGSVLLSNPPAADQTGELYTGRIVEDSALLSRAHAVIGRESKRDLDPSDLQVAQAEFETGVQRLLEEHVVKCVVIISGRNETGIDIRGSETASRGETVELVRARLALDFDLTPNAANNESSSRNLGDEVQMIQLALGPDERGFRREAVVASIADAVGLINAKLGYSERTGDTSD